MTKITEVVILYVFQIETKGLEAVFGYLANICCKCNNFRLLPFSHNSRKHKISTWLLYLIYGIHTNLNKTKISGTSYRLDHSIIKLELSHFKNGRGIWKFNNSLLKHPEYLDLVNGIIEEKKMKYCLPINNYEYVKKKFFLF